MRSATSRCRYGQRGSSPAAALKNPDRLIAQKTCRETGSDKGTKSVLFQRDLRPKARTCFEESSTKKRTHNEHHYATFGRCRFGIRAQQSAACRCPVRGKSIIHQHRCIHIVAAYLICRQRRQACAPIPIGAVFSSGRPLRQSKKRDTLRMSSLATWHVFLQERSGVSYRGER